MGREDKMYFHQDQLFHLEEHQKLAVLTGS